MQLRKIKSEEPAKAEAPKGGAEKVEEAKKGSSLQQQVAARMQERLGDKQAERDSAKKAAAKQDGGGGAKKALLAVALFGVAGVVAAWRLGVFEDGGTKAREQLAALLPESAKGAIGSVMPEAAKKWLEGGHDEKRAKGGQLQMGLSEDAERFEKLLAGVRKAKFGYWRDAPDGDRPGKAKREAEYLCIVPGDGDGKWRMVALATAPGKEMVVEEVSYRGVEDSSAKKFGAMVKGKPYIVIREDRAYVCSEASREAERTVEFGDGGVDPTADEFGALAGILAEIGVEKPGYRWEVEWVGDGGGAVKLGELGWGEKLGRAEAEKRAGRKLVGGKIKVTSRFARR